MTEQKYGVFASAIVMSPLARPAVEPTSMSATMAGAVRRALHYFYLHDPAKKEVSSMVRRITVLLAAIGALSLIAVAAPASAGAATAHGPGLLYQLKATFHVPVPAEAIKKGWCYDGAVVDPQTHIMYLSDWNNKQITVIDPRTGHVSAIGTGLFTGIGGCYSFAYDRAGPDGLAIFGGDIFAGNGNSHVLGFSLRTGQEIADVDTRGKLRADEMAVVWSGGRPYLAVQNPGESPAPYTSFIALTGRDRYQVAARFVFTQATGGLEQPRYWRGHMYVSVPQTVQYPNGGEVDELDISNLAHVQIIHTFSFTDCQPAGLAIRADGLAAVGCGGPRATSQEILNLNPRLAPLGQQTPVPGIPGVDIVAVNGPDFFWVSYTLATFSISNAAGTIIQSFPATTASHTVAVDPYGDVWVPQNTAQGEGQVNLYNPN